jgi:hypothetical protein
VRQLQQLTQHECVPSEAREILECMVQTWVSLYPLAVCLVFANLPSDPQHDAAKWIHHQVVRQMKCQARLLHRGRFGFRTQVFEGEGSGGDASLHGAAPMFKRSNGKSTDHLTSTH